MCKRFCRVAQPLLFKSFITRKLHPSLFQTLCEKRDLAQRVSSFTLFAVPANEVDDEFSCPEFPSTPHVHEALKFVQTILPGAFINRLRERTTSNSNADSEVRHEWDGVQTAVLLSLLPNLEQLGLPLCDNQPSILELFKLVTPSLWTDQEGHDTSHTKTAYEPIVLPKLKMVNLSHLTIESSREGNNIWDFSWKYFSPTTST